MDRDNLPWIVIVVIALGLCVLGGRCCVTGCGSGYSDGERMGQIVKFSRKGLAIKSWEGQLNLGGYTTGEHGAVVANTWEFTVVRDDMVTKIQTAFETGKRVRIHYRQWFSSPISMESDYETTAVEILP